MSIKEKKLKHLSLVISIFITLFFAYKTHEDSREFRDHYESKTLDLRFKLRGEKDPGKDIVIVAIDEESYQQMGKWTGARDKIALLIESISNFGAKAIGIDIMFSEPQVSPALNGLKELQKTYEELPQINDEFLGLIDRKVLESDADKLLARAIKKAGNVTPALAFGVASSEQVDFDFVKEQLNSYDFLFDSVYTVIKEQNFLKDRGLPYYTGSSVLPPIPGISLAAKNLGHVSILPDNDGVLRWEFIYLKVGDDFFPPLGIQLVKDFLKIDPKDIKVSVGRQVELGNIVIPTDELGRTVINYYGTSDKFPYISAYKVINGEIEEGALKDKIVLVGFSALATGDVKQSPFGEIPGVIKHANVIANILHQSFIKRTVWMKPYEVGVVIAFGLILGIFLPRMGALTGALLGFGLLFSYIGFLQYVFVYHGLWFNFIYPAVTILTVYIVTTMLRFLLEERRSKEIRSMFSSYVAPHVVNELMKDPDQVKLGGDRKYLTVLFSDVQGFTTFSEKNTPETVVSLLNEYLTAMTDVVFASEGTLDKFIGDAVMVFWGSPLPQENHPKMAVKCAVEMRRRLHQLWQKWDSEGKPRLDMGVGINTGDMVVGNIGAMKKKMDYTVIGDNVNLGARLEGLTRKYHVPIVISESVYLVVKDMFEASEEIKNENGLKGVAIKELGDEHVKGKEKSVKIYGITLDL